MVSEMKKYIVVSTNNNPDYYHYLPYIEKAWASYGWDLCVMLTHDVDVNRLEVNRKETMLCVFPHVEGLRMETVAQASRLYAAHYFTGQPDTLLMTSDMDLLPLSDYWHPDPTKITNYGHDLTGHSFFPMGYTAMSVSKWIEVMKLTHDKVADMVRDCKEVGIAYSDKWEDWWNTDWTILTKRLKRQDIVSIERGKRPDGIFAKGRIDRGDSMQIIPKPWIDAHMENHNVKHPDKLNRFLSIFEEVYGKL